MEFHGNFCIDIFHGGFHGNYSIDYSVDLQGVSRNSQELDI